jgi:excisionase family DNA binding protein
VLTTTQAAEELGITRKAVHKLVERGGLKVARFGNAFSFLPSDVERAKSRPAPGRPKAKK